MTGMGGVGERMLRRSRQSWTSILLAALGVAAAALVLFTGSLLEARLHERWRAERLSELSGLRAQLEGRLNGAVNLTAGLVAHVAVHGGIEPEEFERLAAELMTERSLLRNITLAPNNVIAMVHPLKGNEAAVGLDLLNHPVQGVATRRMLALGRPVLAGPVELVQGGRALIHRVPIFLSPPEGPPRSGAYWGLMSTPVDFDSLLAQAGLTNPQLRYRIALRGVDGLGIDGAVFWGDEALFADADAIGLDIQVLNGYWRMAALPLDEPTAGGAVWAARLAAMLLAVVTVLMVMKLRGMDMRLTESEQLHRELAEQIRDVLFRTDTAGRVIYLNPAWTQITGREVRACLGYHWTELVETEAGEGVRLRTAELLAAAHVEGDTLVQNERVHLVDRDGMRRTLVVRAGIHRNSSGAIEGVVGIMVDVSEQERLEARVRHLALHDSLTGLANRVLLASRYQQAAEFARRLRHRMGLLYLDLDGFKPVNDTYGHEVGDRVLCGIAERLLLSVRESDTVARVGGDEFVVLLGQVLSVDDARSVAVKVQDILAEPLLIGEQRFTVRASIGIAVFPDHGGSLDELLRAADRAMYRVKSATSGEHIGITDP